MVWHESFRNHTLEIAYGFGGFLISRLSTEEM